MKEKTHEQSKKQKRKTILFVGLEHYNYRSFFEVFGWPFTEKFPLKNDQLQTVSSKIAHLNILLPRPFVE